MFKYFIISVIIVPALIGVTAGKGRNGEGNRSGLRFGWLVYVVLWVGTLHYLRFRWAW